MSADDKDRRPGTSLSILAVGASPGSHSGRPMQYLASLEWQGDGQKQMSAGKQNQPHNVYGR
ncbi:hypothetical protein DPMN_135131 [Dreissena polymorpha]|uniref:Uncharacterized protein n=1 Tax=Dreissena polymorpha TaxID=45954 RepID=A0A9D4G183_DREPO|nr:hypothetical protein DPMN_135131 [Dreissena polymorpha]